MDPSAYPLHADVEERHWWFVARRRIVAARLASLGLRAGAALIELGSGTGGNLAMLSRFGRVTAVEPDDGARAASLRRHPRVEHLASLDALAGRDAFDAALALDVLEHLDDPTSALRRLGAWLLPGAPLLVTVPAHPWLFGQHDAYLHHRRRYTAPLLREHLDRGGFDVERLAPFNALSLPAAAALRLVEAARERLAPGAPPRPRGMGVPPAGLNRALALAMETEARLPLPAGLSWLAVARLRTPGPAGAP